MKVTKLAKNIVERKTQNLESRCAKVTNTFDLEKQKSAVMRRLSALHHLHARLLGVKNS
jgi:hypothetical protein